MSAVSIRRATRPKLNGQSVSLPVLMRGLIYRGGLAVREEYWVFESEHDYLVVSPSAENPRSLRVTVVSKVAVDRVYARFTGQKVTCGQVNQFGSKLKYLAREFEADSRRMYGHNVLYVLESIGAAEHWLKGSHDQLHFSIKKLRADFPFHYWRAEP